MYESYGQSASRVKWAGGIGVFSKLRGLEVPGRLQVQCVEPSRVPFVLGLADDSSMQERYNGIRRGLRLRLTEEEQLLQKQI